MMGYHTRIVRSLAELDSLLPAWNAFVSTASVDDNLHQNPDIVRLIVASAQEDLQPCIVVVERDSAIVCIAPFYIQKRPFPLRLGLLKIAALSTRLLRMFGDRLIAAKGQLTPEAIQRVFQALDELRGRFDMIEIQNLILPSEVWEHFRQRRSPAYKLVVASPHPEKVLQLRFDAAYDEYFAGMGSKTRKRLRQLERFVSGQCELVKVTEPDQVRWFLEQVTVVSGRSWQAKTYGLPDRTGDAHVARFQAVAEKGWLRSYVLVTAGQPIAFVLGYQYKSTYSYDETGYDLSWAHSSPGSALTHCVVKDLFAVHPPALLDFGFGDSEYKRTFGNVEHDACSVYVIPRNRWRAIVALQRVFNYLYELIRSTLIRLRLDRAVRKLVKGQRSASRKPVTP